MQRDSQTRKKDATVGNQDVNLTKPTIPQGDGITTKELPLSVSPMAESASNCLD